MKAADPEEFAKLCDQVDSAEMDLTRARVLLGIVLAESDRLREFIRTSETSSWIAKVGEWDSIEHVIMVALDQMKKAELAVRAFRRSPRPTGVPSVGRYP